MRDGHKKKFCVDTFTSHVSEVVIQIFKQVQNFLETCKPEELVLPSEIIKKDSEEGRKWKVLRHQRRATCVVRVLFVNHIFIAVERRWLTKYVWKALEHIHDSYIAEIAEELGAVELLVSDFKMRKERVRSSVQNPYCFLIMHYRKNCRIF